MANSLDIGVTPGKFIFSNLLRGGYAEEFFKIYSKTSSSVYFRIDSLNKTYDISEWLTLKGPDGNELKLGNENLYPFKDGKFRLKVEVRLPDDIPNGLYKARLMVYGSDALVSKGLTAMDIIARAAIDLEFEVSDEQFIKCDVKDFKMTSVERGQPSQLSFFLRNWGNVIFDPEVKLKIYDSTQETLVKELTLSNNPYKPTEYKTYNAEISTDDLDYGQYWVEITIPKCDFKDSPTNSKIVSFDVLEPGQIGAEGTIVDVKHKTKVITGDNIPIKVVFRNTGEKSVLAHSVVSIYFNGELIDKLKSDSLNVKPGEEKEFITFFSPQMNGTYNIKMNVKYNNKQTYPIEDKLYVFGDDLIENYKAYSESKNFNYGYVLVFLVLIIIFFIMIIAKKKRRKRHKFSF
jgi:hypothetical protein